MRARRFTFRDWSVRVALGLCAACAADAGDPSKVDDSIQVAVMDAGEQVAVMDAGEQVAAMDAGERPDVGSLPSEDSSGGSDVGSIVETSVPEGDADTGILNDAAVLEAGGEGAVPDAGGSLDAPAACLTNIPSSCPVCMTQNASDVPICQKYLTCFADNDCNPSTACGSNDGVCGVNTIGGGEAPLTAAIQTYGCACP